MGLPDSPTGRGAVASADWRRGEPWRPRSGEPPHRAPRRQEPNLQEHAKEPVVQKQPDGGPRVPCRGAPGAGAAVAGLAGVWRCRSRWPRRGYARRIGDLARRLAHHQALAGTSLVCDRRCFGRRSRDRTVGNSWSRRSWSGRWRARTPGVHRLACSRRQLLQLPPSAPAEGAVGACSSGWTARRNPSRSALRRARSACASSIEDEWLLTPIPRSTQRSRASLLVSPSSRASS